VAASYSTSFRIFRPRAVAEREEFARSEENRHIWNIGEAHCRRVDSLSMVFISQWRLFHHLIQNRTGKQVWLTDIYLRHYMEGRLHGSPSYGSERKVYSFYLGFRCLHTYDIKGLEHKVLKVLAAGSAWLSADMLLALETLNSPSQYTSSSFTFQQVMSPARAMVHCRREIYSILWIN
jgi:hypothetical protein